MKAPASTEFLDAVYKVWGINV